MSDLSDEDLLKRFVRQMALASFRELTHLDMSVDEIAQIDQAPCDWTALISLNGPAMKVALRFHFTTPIAQALASSAFGNQPSDVPEVEAKDFMMELSNITSGRVKRALSLNEIMVGMSLPLVNPGLGEIHAESAAEWSMDDKWALKSPKGNIACTVRFESSETFSLIDPDSLSEEAVQISVP